MDTLKLNELWFDTTNSEQFLRKQSLETARRGLKYLYDPLQKTEGPETALPELIVKNFDNEAIWHELELQSDPHYGSLDKCQSQNFNIEESDSAGEETEETGELSGDEEEEGDEEDNELPSEEDEEDDELSSEAEEDEAEDDDLMDLFKKQDNDNYDSDESEEEVMLKKLLEKAEGEGGDEDEDDEEEDGEEESEGESEEEEMTVDSKASKKIVSKGKKQKTDDQFFKTSEMNAFLDLEDRKEKRRLETGEDDDEEEINYFEDIDEEEGENAKELRYDDFFASNEEPARKRVRFDDGQEEEEEDDDEAEEEEENENESKPRKDLLGSDSDGEETDNVKKSSLESRQERLNSRIESLEDGLLAPKSWHLTGEIQGTSRPLNAALEEDLDFGQQSRPVRIVTEEFTATLESIIIQRIKDKAWDDVVRKTKPKELGEYKKRLVLDQEKSKEGLAAIYEQEYLKQAREEEEDKKIPEHEEIKKDLTALFLKLDALSNFQFTPKQASTELEVVRNLLAIAVEEVQPASVSDAQRLAPEEIQEKPKREEKGETEKTKTDKNRARKQKKKVQKLKAKRREEKEKEKGGKPSKEQAKKTIKEAKNVKVMKDGGPSAVKSSKAFFKQLEEIKNK